MGLATAAMSPSGHRFVFRRTVDAACRLAGFQPNIKFESRGPNTLLAMADNGHGVAVIPSAPRTDRWYTLRIVGCSYHGKPLRERLAFWDKRLPGHATAFCELVAEYMR